MVQIVRQASRYLRVRRAFRRYLSVLLCLVMIVSMAPGALAINDGGAMTRSVSVLVCPFSGVAAHTHSALCYDETGALVCLLPERALHQHSDTCYTEDLLLVCGQEEILEEHIHGPACFVEIVVDVEVPELTPVETVEPAPEEAAAIVIPELTPVETVEPAPEEAAAIVIPELTPVERVEPTPEEATPIMTQEKTPAEAPAAQDTPAAEESAIEQVVEQTLENTEKEVEVETPAPEELVDQSLPDPNADREQYWMWLEAMQAVALSGDWNEDLVAVARTQLGYTESERNFIEDETGRHSYTRYGDWYGLPYGEWCAMFISFCLSFAGIPEEAMPYECGTIRWVDLLRERDLFVPFDAGYIPKAGDLVFFAGEGNGERFPCHVGIVSYVDSEGWFRTIEGNHTPTVEEFVYPLDDAWLFGYGILPAESQPETEPAVEKPTAEPEPEEEPEPKDRYALYEDKTGDANDIEEAKEINEEASKEVEKDKRLSVSVSAMPVEGDVLTYTIRLSSKTGTEQWTRLTSVMNGAYFDRDLRITDENGGPVSVKDGLVSHGDKQFSFCFGTMYPGKEITVLYQAHLTDPEQTELVNTVTATCTFDEERLSVEALHRMPEEEPNSRPEKRPKATLDESAKRRSVS